MKLYDAPFAPSPRRVRMFLAEKGISVPTETVDIAAGETQTPAFARINPVGELPVLELDDGTRLTESLAICRYFEALHPTPPLMGTSAEERAQLEALALQIMFRIYVPTTQAFRHGHRFWEGRITQVPAYAELARAQVLAEWQRIDGLLADREFLGGAQFSYVDIVAYTTLDFGKPSGIRVLAEQTRLARWQAAIAARPSAKA